MRVSELHGQPLAILLWYVNEGFDSSAAVINGILENRDGHLALIRGAGLPPVSIPWKMATGIQPVPENVKDIMGQAKLWLEMTVRDLQGANPHTIKIQS